MPESPFYCVSTGDLDKAKKILERMAQSNGKVLPAGRLVSELEKQRIAHEVAERHGNRSAETEMNDSLALETLHTDTYEKHELTPEELDASLV